MLSPRPFLRPSLLPSRLCAQCLRRLQSTNSRGTPTQDSSHPNALPSEDLQPHHRKISQLHPLIPSYPTPPPNARARQNAKAKEEEKEDPGFSPALTGFIAGAMIAAGAMFLGYHMLGSARVVRATSDRHNKLVEERKRLFPLPLVPHVAGDPEVGGREGNPSDKLLEEQVRWFEDAANFYALYVAGADDYIVRNLGAGEMVKARSTPKGEVAVSEIIKNCVHELERLIGGGELGLMVGKQCWGSIEKHIEMIVDVAEEGRDVPEHVRQKVRKQLEALKKTGSRSGRQERRLLEERAMAEEKS